MTYTYLNSQSQQGSWAQIVKKTKFSDDQYREKCFEITGTKCLHRLKEWCKTHEICQSTWANLTCNIISRILKPTDDFKKQVFCCIKEEINDRAQDSEHICDLLGIQVISIAELYEPLMPPSGSGSHTIKFNREIYTGNLAHNIEFEDVIYQYGREYHTLTTEIHGCSDPYTAALTLLDPEELAYGQKMLASSKTIGNLMPDYF